jgi:hypothetical protein
MSSKSRNAEKRREREAAYLADCQAREAAEHEFQEKFGGLIARLDELGIDADLLAEFIAARLQR